MATAVNDFVFVTMFWNTRVYSGVYCAIGDGTKVGGVCEGIGDGFVLLLVEESWSVTDG